MDIETKVNRQKYYQKRDNPLKSFANTVVEKGEENPDYSGQAEQILAVKTKNTAYDAALSLAETYGGTDRTDDKDNCRTDLLEVLDALVELLEKAAPSKPNPGAFLRYLGFELAKKPTRRMGTVAKPVIKTIISGGKDARRGTVKFVLKAEDPLEIKAVIGRRSDDNGVTWVNGIVSTKLAFELSDQPSGVYALYEFMFIATNNRESGWSTWKGVSVA